MRNSTNLFIAALIALVALAPSSPTWAQIAGGNRQVGSPTRDSDAGRGTRAPSSSTRRMEAGTTQQRRTNAAPGGTMNFDSGARRTLFGNSGSAAGNGRPRNTTLNPAARDPLSRNPAILDPVTGVPATGPVRNSSAFDGTGRSLIQGRGIDDATFVEQIAPTLDELDRGALLTEDFMVEPSTTDVQVADDLSEFSDSPISDTITSEAADRIETPGFYPPLPGTYPNANSAVLDGSADSPSAPGVGRNRRGQTRDEIRRPQVTDPNSPVTSSGRRITGTAAEAVRAARVRAQQQRSGAER